MASFEDATKIKFQRLFCLKSTLYEILFGNYSQIILNGIDPVIIVSYLLFVFLSVLLIVYYLQQSINRLLLGFVVYYFNLCSPQSCLGIPELSYIDNAPLMINLIVSENLCIKCRTYIVVIWYTRNNNNNSLPN